MPGRHCVEILKGVIVLLGLNKSTPKGSRKT